MLNRLENQNNSMDVETYEDFIVFFQNIKKTHNKPTKIPNRKGVFWAI